MQLLLLFWWSLSANDCFNGYPWGELRPITNKCGFINNKIGLLGKLLVATKDVDRIIS